MSSPSASSSSSSSPKNVQYDDMVVAIVDNEIFGYLRLSRTMVSDHLPGPYEKVLRHLDVAGT